jgi:hypothetical protein
MLLRENESLFENYRYYNHISSAALLGLPLAPNILYNYLVHTGLSVYTNA